MIIKCRIGDIVAIQKSDFPVVLRDGPGFSYNRTCEMSPTDLAIVLAGDIGHGAHIWIQLLVASNGKKGWIPETILIVPD